MNNTLIITKFLFQNETEKTHTFIIQNNEKIENKIILT